MIPKKIGLCIIYMLLAVYFFIDTSTCGIILGIIFGTLGVLVLLCDGDGYLVKDNVRRDEDGRM